MLRSQDPGHDKIAVTGLSHLRERVGSVLRNDPFVDAGILLVSSIMSSPEPSARSCRGPGEWAPGVLLVSPHGRPAPGDYGAWLDAGPGVACKSLAQPPTVTYIVIHGSYS